MIGQTILHYQITAKIGAGGMGEVYLATDTKLDREVALKFLPRQFSGDPDARSRFQREAKALATLNHPNIVTVFEVDEHEGQPFIAMEYLKGRSLKQLIADDDLSIDRVIDITMQLADGLAASHNAEVVHRDIKSENIIISDEGRVKIMDFGLATWRGVTRVTQEGSTVGTMAYMSPEQTAGHAVDQRADLWSLGVVMYEMLTRRLPFDGEHQAAIVYAIAHDPHQPVTRYRADVPPRLETIAHKALEKDPETRYQTASGLMADLKMLRRQTESSVIAMQPTKAGRRSVGSTAVIIAGAVTIVVLAALIWLKPWQTAQQPEITEMVEPTMLAVLPFTNLGDPGDEFFADGVTEEILTNLSRIDGLGVISRTSTMQYRETDKSLKEIGAELGVEYVLQASIQWQKTDTVNRIRLHPQLIRVSDDVNVWAGRFDAILDDLFEVQSTIAAEVAEALSLALLLPNSGDNPARPTENAEAYEFYLQAQGYLGAADGQYQDRAVELFEESIRLDSGFALAWAGLSKALSGRVYGDVNPDPSLAGPARAAAEQALALQPGLPQGRVAMGLYYNLVEREYEKALSEFEAARASGVEEADVLRNIGFVQQRQGLFDDALLNYSEALRLDPASEDALYSLSAINMFLRRFVEAARHAELLIARKPDDPSSYNAKAVLYLVWKGSEASREVIRSAPAFIDPMEIVISSRPVPDPALIHFRLLDGTLPELIDHYREIYDPSVAAPPYHTGLAFLYQQAGDTLAWRAHADSARIALEGLLTAIGPDEDDLELTSWFHSLLGLSYAKLGDFERAKKEAQKGMDMLPTSSCHL